MRVSLVFYVSLVSGSHFSVLLRRTRDLDSIGSWFLERHAYDVSISQNREGTEAHALYYSCAECPSGSVASVTGNSASQGWWDIMESYEECAPGYLIAHSARTH